MPKTLLLADDSITVQRVIELTFADEDVQVVAVSDGDQAIAHLDASPPDIVLADVGMPGKNGYEVARYVKDSPTLSHIPVVLLTGAFEPVDPAKAAEARCDGVLAKPFEPQQVISRVRELLARPRQAPKAPDLELTPPTSAQAEAAKPASDGYFDRLDEALSNLSGSRSVGTPAEAWPGAADDLPLAYEPPSASAASQPAQDMPTSEALRKDVESASEPPVYAPAPVARTLPPIADAFAALLAAEQSRPSPGEAPAWPASLPPTPAPPAIDTADLVEQVARRVLEELSDRVVRETVAEIASSVAERLVSEEIERIKASIK